MHAIAPNLGNAFGAGDQADNERRVRFGQRRGELETRQQLLNLGNDDQSGTLLS